MCHSCVHLRAENIRLTAEVAALRASNPVREMRALLAEQVREFRFTSLQSHFLVARSELANCRQAMSYLMTALSSSDGERSALRGIVALCECAAKPGGAETAAPGLVAAENVAAQVLFGGFAVEPVVGSLPPVCILCCFFRIFFCTLIWDYLSVLCSLSC